MKKICILGSSRGIGKSIHEFYKKKGWAVEGLSSTKGYDLNITSQRLLAVDQSLKSDIIISCSRCSAGEIMFVEDLALRVQKPEMTSHQRLLIVFSSIAAHDSYNRSFIPNDYAQYKKQLGNIALNLAHNLDKKFGLKITVFEPGFFSSDRVIKSGIAQSDEVLAIDQVIEYLDQLISLPQHIHIPRASIMKW
jgi:NAD(P)-dependent dehydrogenase (short-subunit alcohol dehydrogenase family)